jgi:hypothetical protein
MNPFPVTSIRNYVRFKGKYNPLSLVAEPEEFVCSLFNDAFSVSQTI